MISRDLGDVFAARSASHATSQWNYVAPADRWLSRTRWWYIDVLPPNAIGEDDASVPGIADVEFHSSGFAAG
jgi:hypothetical protein